VTLLCPKDASLAFSRNLGWITYREQTKLKESCVAVAGLGGAGGLSAVTLARLGVGSFKLADPELFELTDINRQTGASWNTTGLRKTEVIRRMILGINPEASVETFPEGVTEENIESFLKEADLAIDGIDLFNPRAKLLFFGACRKKRIFVITSCPLGFGASLLVFSPDGMSWEEYLGISSEMDDRELILRSLFGLSPSALALAYASPEVFDPSHLKGSTVACGLTLVASLAATEAVKILTGKRRMRCSPYIFQVDLMTQKVVKKVYSFGMRSMLQRIKRALILNIMKIMRIRMEND